MCVSLSLLSVSLSVRLLSLQSESLALRSEQRAVCGSPERSDRGSAQRLPRADAPAAGGALRHAGDAAAADPRPGGPAVPAAERALQQR